MLVSEVLFPHYIVTFCLFLGNFSAFDANVEVGLGQKMTVKVVGCSRNTSLDQYTGKQNH